MVRFLRTTLLTCLLAGIGIAAANNNILTCSAALPPQLACSYERVGWSLFGLEGGAGAYIEVSDDVSITPFTVLGYYGTDTAYWVEFTVPDGVLPNIGDDNRIVTVGGEIRW